MQMRTTDWSKVIADANCRLVHVDTRERTNQQRDSWINDYFFRLMTLLCTSFVQSKNQRDIIMKNIDINLYFKTNPRCFWIKWSIIEVETKIIIQSEENIRRNVLSLFPLKKLLNIQNDDLQVSKTSIQADQ